MRSSPIRYQDLLRPQVISLSVNALGDETVGMDREGYPDRKCG
jgi:hypothetical protein